MRLRTGRTIGLAAVAAAVVTPVMLALMSQGVIPNPFKSEASRDRLEQGGVEPAHQPPVKLGLSINLPQAFQGYTLLAPIKSTKTYLIDMEGRIVRTWTSDSTPAMSAYLLENGHLLRAAALPGVPGSEGAGAGGRVQEFTWEGDLVWDFKFSTDKQLPHHDILRLPNGNVLMIVWDRKTAQEALAAGRRPDLIGRFFLLDCLMEIKPTGKTTGEVVWEWHLWNHLIQDHDKSKANYGNVAEHPELVDVNYWMDVVGLIARAKDGMDKLKSIGYVASGAPARPAGVNPDWSHFNGVAYNPELDQIAVSVHALSELWIIDHSTTKAQAAGHFGGRYGRGGDLLYRWGNPSAYRAGTKADQRFFAQHDAHWIPRGLPGAGRMLVFNNGGLRPAGRFSTVDELVLPVDDSGRYTRQVGSAYGPEKPIWSYGAPGMSDFFSILLSGAQHLPNGNTLICSGSNGTLLEVTPEKEVVWKYVVPPEGGFGAGDGHVGPLGTGLERQGGTPRSNQILASAQQEQLLLSSDQKSRLDEFQKEVDGKLDKMLTVVQTKTFHERGGFGGFPLPGQIMSSSRRALLKPTSEQVKQLDDLQQEVDAKLGEILSNDQKKQFAKMREEFLRGGPSSSGSGRLHGPDAFGPTGGSSVFRAYRYGHDYAGLVGKNLYPGRTSTTLHPKESNGKQAR